MTTPIRFWGRILAIRPRLTLTKFAGETVARSQGHLLLIEGTRQVANSKPTTCEYTVAIGPATLHQKQMKVGDLIRGDGHPIPADTPDVPADLYRVGVLRVIAPAGHAGAGPVPAPDSPRTDRPLTSEETEAAPRRVLCTGNLAVQGACRQCAYGTIIPVVRLTDPRNPKSGTWSQIPACLGPANCPHYKAP